MESRVVFFLVAHVEMRMTPSRTPDVPGDKAFRVFLSERHIQATFSFGKEEFG